MSANEEILLLVDESYADNFCAICVVCIQGKENLTLLNDQIRQISVDPAVNIHDLAKIFHYNEASIGGRQSIASWIYRMPISVYCVISKSNVSKSKQTQDEFAYKTLFPELVKPLRQKFFNRFHGEKISIRFENLNNKLDTDTLFFKEVLKDIPEISVSVVSKENDQLIFLPDYFLGFIKDHLSKGKLVTWPTDLLKLLSGKIGLLLFKDASETRRYGRGDEIAKFLS